MRRYRWARRACAALTLVCSLSTAACSGSPADPKPTATASAVAMSADCKSIVAMIGSLWDPSRDGTAGYGDAQNLEASPSLYLTSWSVQLAQFEHWSTPGLQRSSVSSYLSKEVELAASEYSSSQLSEASFIDLAVHGLAALGQKPSTDVAALLEPLRRDGRYAASPGAAPSWSATYLAVDAIVTAGAKVPASVIDALRSEATGLGANAESMSGDTLLETDIPVVAALSQSLDPVTLGRTLPSLPAWLSAWQATLMSTTISAVPLGADLTVHQIAQRGHITLPNPALSSTGGLVTMSGYLALTSNDSTGDPQATLDAAQLGLKLGGTAKAALQVGMTPRGWVSAISAPSLIATYQAVLASYQCGSSPHTDVLPTLVSSSIQQLLAELGSPAAAPMTWLADAGRLCTLRAIYGQRTDRDLAPQVSSMITRLVGGKSVDSTAVGVAVLAATACGMAVPSSAVPVLEHSLSGLQAAPTALGAQILADAGRVLKDPSLITQARTAILELKVGALFRASKHSTRPDITSTEIGYSLTSTLGSPGSRAALQHFMIDGIPAAYPAAESSVDVQVNLSSLESGALLEQGGLAPAVIW